VDAAACKWELVVAVVGAVHVELPAQGEEEAVQHVVQHRLQPDLHPVWILTPSDFRLVQRRLQVR